MRKIGTEGNVKMEKRRLGGSRIVGNMSFRAFLENGAEYVASLGIEPDAYAIAQSAVGAIMEVDKSADLDTSELIWRDLSHSVDLGHSKHTPTVLYIEISGTYSYFVGIGGYPSSVSGGLLDRNITTAMRWKPTVTVDLAKEAPKLVRETVIQVVSSTVSKIRP